MAVCMETAEIVKKVLKNFSSTELLELSLVNKGWNYEARCLMKERGNLAARKTFGQLSCEYLKDLATDVQQMSVVPFRGIHIDLPDLNCAYRNGSRTEELDFIYGNVFDRVQYKHLSVRLSKGWEIHNNCPGLGLVKKILNNPCSGLEEISVLLKCERRELFIQQVLEQANLSSLKTFMLLQYYGTADEDHTDLVKVLVSRAPDLQLLYTECRVNLDANLLAGSSALHVTNYGFCAIRGIPDSVAGEIRMTKIVLSPHTWDFSLDRFNRITPMLLQNSRTLLNTVVLNGIFLVPLMQYAICLENVKELEVVVDSDILERSPEQILRVMKNFDFTRIFPRLVRVEVNYSYSPTDLSQDQINEMAEVWNGGSDEPTLDRVVNIKSLSLHLRSNPDDVLFGFLAEMLPEVEKISVYSPAQNIPFTFLWRQFWVNLKHIEVIMFADSWVVEDFGNHINLDDKICGIDPEEVEFLRGQNEDYLRNVNIVPMAASISHLKGLTTFKLIFEEPASFEGPLDDPTYLFSKVTRLIAFQRCPDLTVTLKLDNQRRGRDLTHLEPYVSRVTYRRGF